MPSILGITASFNTTQTSLSNTISSSMGLGIVVTLLLFVVLIIALVGIISSIERYTAFFKAIERIVSTIKYALYGSGVLLLDMVFTVLSTS